MLHVYMVSNKLLNPDLQRVIFNAVNLKHLSSSINFPASEFKPSGKTHLKGILHSLTINTLHARGRRFAFKTLSN